MTREIIKERKTAFKEFGFNETIKKILKQIQDLYLSDEIPWVVGYSGGKDSTATLQLVWIALQGLDSNQWHKPVHVISTDTLVENPIVALWVEKSLKTMATAIGQLDSKFPVRAHRLAPELYDRFWVNLIGRGYPAPRPKFRWCTSRLKISPSNNFINNVVKQNGEAILVLGTRKAESAARAATMKHYQEKSTRELLSDNKDLDRVWVYAPIENWQNDDVWQYLTQIKNPWGYKNSDLLGMYTGATEDGECPLVVDTSTPSCGDSRFGCYVCTMVDEDKSMKAMVQNDIEKEWMLPILDFRNNWLSVKNEKRESRDFRRMNGALTLFNDRLVHGPYTQSHREAMLFALLETQEAVRELAPKAAEDFRLIGLDELEEIRRIWVMEKHEIEDSLPLIYEKATGHKYPGKDIYEKRNFKLDDLELLKNLCIESGDKEGIIYQLIRELLHIEHQNRTSVRRSKLFNEMRESLQKAVFKSEDEALEFARKRKVVSDGIEADINFFDTHIIASDLVV
ncbi:MAG: sulfurtransferase DndC [Cellvibrio sp. 79]|nr:MAG: sulfurtransferase DndC [Cellvibrio sp. 79]